MKAQLRTWQAAGWRLRTLSVLLAVCLASLTVAAGCQSDGYLKLRKVPRNPLEGPLQLLSHKGPQPTERTEQLLQRYDLNRDKGVKALGALQAEFAREPTPDKAYALAELFYVQGVRSEALTNHDEALNEFAGAVAYAYMFLFDRGFDDQRNPYDPEFRRACDVYNGGLESVMRLVHRRGWLVPGKELVIDTGTQRFVVHVDVESRWRAEEIGRMEFASDYEVVGLRNRHHSYGLGVPMIAVRTPTEGSQDPAQRYYPPGLSFPLTAFLRVTSPDVASQGAPPTRHCVLEFFDPLVATDIVVAGRRIPLETDISAPLAYTLDQPGQQNKLELATWGLLDPESTQKAQGLYMVEPFDPRKVPVIMVHGLWSSPLTWMEMFNDLRSFPEIRDNFQFWFYLYPTGQPFWNSAAQFRRDLAEMHRTIDPEHRYPTLDQMVLVGHSMGGLVSKMQTVYAGDDFWHIISDRPFEELHASEEERQRIAEAVFFLPNQSVRRVITIGTPHRGSRFANEYTRFIGRKLISLPAQMVQSGQRLLTNNPGFFRNTDLLAVTTSIDSLAPDSPVLPVLLHARRAEWVTYDNIVGELPTDTFWSRFREPGDGVVGLASAELDDVEAQTIVPADHVSVHAHPRSILEVRRLLLEHLHEMYLQGGRGAPSAVVPAGMRLPMAAPARP